MKRTLSLGLLSLLLLSSCTSPARIVNKNPSPQDPEPPTSSSQTTPTPTQTTTKTMESYNIQEKISQQISGEVKETFEYLVTHRDDTTSVLEDIHLGYFTQNHDGELMVIYTLEYPQSENHSFIFILDVYTGTLISSHFLTADHVEIFLLDSPLSTKVFVTQNSIIDGIPHSNATLYSCLAGEWTPSSALTEFSTVPPQDQNLSNNYIYTYRDEVLTVEAQTLSTEQESQELELSEQEDAEQENTELENTELENSEQENTELENSEQENSEQENSEQENSEQENSEQENSEQENTELESQTPQTTLHGTYIWDENLSIFQKNNDV